MTATRYNGAGHDVRLEVCGSKDARFVGPRRPRPHADRRALDLLAARPPYATFMERFHDAYVAELACFVDVAAGRTPSPCPPAEALEALYVAEACELSRHRGRPVDVRRRPCRESGRTSPGPRRTPTSTAVRP